MLFFVILAFGRFATAVLFSSAAMLAFALLYYGAALLILRRSERVPEERWNGPRIVDHRALLIRRGERVSLVPAALLALLCLLAVFSGRPGAVTDMLPVILLLADYVGFALPQRRLHRRRDMLIDGSEEDIATLATLHRTLLAALIAPSATGVVLIEIEALAVGDLVGGVGAHFWLLVGCYVLSYTIGLPLYLVARRRGWRNCAAYVTGAFAMGMAAFPILIAIMALSAPGTNNLASAFGVDRSDWLFGLSATGILATPIGLLFWAHHATRPVSLIAVGCRQSGRHPRDHLSSIAETARVGGYSITPHNRRPRRIRPP